MSDFSFTPELPPDEPEAPSPELPQSEPEPSPELDALRRGMFAAGAHPEARRLRPRPMP